MYASILYPGSGKSTVVGRQSFGKKHHTLFDALNSNPYNELMLIPSLRQRNTGFTIVELLIVIVVIAILAAIVIVAYNGIQRQAAAAVLKSDLRNAASQLDIAKTNSSTNTYPADDASLARSSGTEFEYSSGGSDFCLTATSTVSGVAAYHISNTTGTIVEGPCDGHAGPGGDEPVSFDTLTWTEQAGANFSAYASLAMSADGTKIALGEYSDYIYTSADGGVTWTQRTSSGQRPWSSIASSADGQKLAAVTNGGYIYTSTDGGATWTERTSAGNAYWYDVAISSDGTKIVAVDYDAEFPMVSNNGGATWSTKTYDNWYGYSSVDCSDDCSTILAGTEGGQLYTSTNSGATWTERTGAGGEGAWYGVAVSGDGTTLYAADNDTYNNLAYIYKSTDDGATWAALTAAGSRRWYRIDTSTDGSKVAVVLRNNNPYTSIDGGATWVSQEDLPYNYWVDVSVSSNGAKIIATQEDGAPYTGAYGP